MFRHCNMLLSPQVRRIAQHRDRTRRGNSSFCSLLVIQLRSCIFILGMHSGSRSRTRDMTLIRGLNHGWNHTFVIDIACLPWADLNRQTGRPNRILSTDQSVEHPFLSLTIRDWHVPNGMPILESLSTDRLNKMMLTQSQSLGENCHSVARFGHVGGIWKLWWGCCWSLWLHWPLWRATDWLIMESLLKFHCCHCHSVWLLHSANSVYQANRMTLTEQSAKGQNPVLDWCVRVRSPVIVLQNL